MGLHAHILIMLDAAALLTHVAQSLQHPEKVERELEKI